MGWTHYLPIVTTGLALAFTIVLARAWLTRRTGPHLLWWCAGAFFYGAGTAVESAITLFGNTPTLTKEWYITGALLGGYPLAQGVVYLLLPRAKANLLTWITVPVVLAGVCFVLLSPVDLNALELTRPSGKVLAWAWVRYLTPFVNLYSVFWLVGGAILSAFRYQRTREGKERFTGNLLIAAGATLPGVGGAFAKGGLVEALYVGELAGLILIWWGYHVISSAKGRRAVVASSVAS